MTWVLRIGVGVGAKQGRKLVDDNVKRGFIEKRVNPIMVDKEAEEIRSTAEALRKMVTNQQILI